MTQGNQSLRKSHFGHPPSKFWTSSSFNSILGGLKSVRIASLFSLIFLIRQTNFSISGVPYPLVSTVGFAISAI